MSEPFVIPLAQAGLADLALVGGKAVHLGELVRAGFPVPPGFCLTAAAYQAMLAQPGLAEAITAALDGLDPTDLDALPRAAAAVRAAFAAAALPDDLAAALDQAYHDLTAPEPDGPVAVRSSATIEDQAAASFAGQGETFLNVRGTAALHAAVKDCWASFWSPQALAYRARQGSPRKASDALSPFPRREGGWGVRSTQAPGVLVQRMVRPEAAGVLFTADPVAGHRDRLVVEAVPGLGEALVQGAATPERYVLGRPDLALREWIAAPGRTGALLSLSQAQELARLGLRAEELFGAPQDLEWALAEGTLAVLQSRPITTVPAHAGALPETAALPPRMAQMLAERMPEPPTPFDVSAVFEPILASVGALPRTWSRSLPFLEQDGVVVGLNPSGGFAGTLWPRLVTLLAVSLRYRPEDWFRKDLPRLERTLADFERVDLPSRSDAEVLAYLRHVSAAMEVAFRERWRYVAASLRSLGPLMAILQPLEGAQAMATLSDLLGGVPTVTTAIDAEIARVARLIRATPALAALFQDRAPEELASRFGRPAQGDADPAIVAFRRELHEFLARYGSREVGGPGAANPSWGDDPAVVLATLASVAGGTGNEEQGTRNGEPGVGNGGQRAEEVRERILARLPGGPLRGLFLQLVARSREAYRLREDSHFHLMRFLPRLRRGALELGRRWTARGLLPDPEQVFLLRLDELEALARGDLAVGPVLERRTARRAEARRRWAGYGLAAARASAGPAATYAGTGASRGTVVGQARVLRQERDFHRLRPGEVLVAPYTSPSWTPLFAVAAGLVVETGAILSHAAIVAREYGIPAVVGLAGATHLFHDGELLAVDGARGTVRRIDAGEAGPPPESVEPAKAAAGDRRALLGVAVGIVALGLLALLARRARR